MQYYAKMTLLSIMLFSFSFSVKADILLLVHGFQSDMLTWQRAGIIGVLEQHGWEKTDYLMATAKGIVPLHTPEKTPQKKIVSLQLPSDIQLRVQANMFTAALHHLADQYPNDKVIVVGHSLGGLTARLSLVKNGEFQVTALITIASPHLGSDLAMVGMEQLNDNSMMKMMKRMFGGGRYQMLERSAPVIYDILPEYPGNLLYALNRRTHPNIAYFSVVRSFSDGRLGDPIVPGYSQNMHSVAAIRRASLRILQGNKHALTQQDAYSILNAIDAIK